MCSRLWAVAFGVAVVAAGCGPSAQVTKCVPMSGPSPLVTGAKLLKLDLYPSTVGCVGDVVAPNAGAPVLSRSFHPGDAVNVDVAPGTYTILFTTYSDAAGTVETGTACKSATLQPGAQFCLDLTVEPAPDLSVEDASDDLSVCTGASCPCMDDSDCPNPDHPRCGPGKVCVPCLPTNDNCPANQYCSQSLQCTTGCKENSDCTGARGSDDGGATDGGSSATTPFCDTTRHNCVQCLSSNDCDVGELCSPSGACVQGCDLTMGKGCPGTLSCCNKLCVDTRSDPLNCSACNLPCTGAKTLCCNSVCADPTSENANCGGCGMACSTVNGTPTCSTGKCSWACNANFAHCATGNTGCETSTTTLTNCGGCGNVCNGGNANTTSCTGTTCQYTCKPGFADCVTTAPDTNGCETNLATAGEKLCGAACIPTTSCCTNADCTTPPGPAACYTPTCTVATGACSYAQKAGSQVCGATCCLAINGTCNPGTCTLTCTGGFADCNGNPSDGCETNLASAGLKLCGTQCIAAASCCSATDCTTPPSPSACYNSGTCPVVGGACSYTQKIGSQICGATCCLPINGTCNAGTCTLNCSSGTGDCNNNPTDGCETNTNTSLSHCGGCGRACVTTGGVATAQCTSGLCTSTCSSGFGNCTQPAFPTADNGCETTTLTDANNCGACGRVCSSTHTNVRSCAAGVCNSSCSGVFANCSQPAAPTADNGCECAGNACCGTGTTCQTQHADGFGESFFDCAALNTFNQTEAMAACTAHTGNAAKCSTFQCAPQVGTTPVDGVVCDNNGLGSSCHCWDFSEPGQTGIAPGSIDDTCLCPFTGETPMWN